jgi:hypothetical protein
LEPVRVCDGCVGKVGANILSNVTLPPAAIAAAAAASSREEDDLQKAIRLSLAESSSGNQLKTSSAAYENSTPRISVSLPQESDEDQMLAAAIAASLKDQEEKKSLSSSSSSQANNGKGRLYQNLYDLPDPTGPGTAFSSYQPEKSMSKSSSAVYNEVGSKRPSISKPNPPVAHEDLLPEELENLDLFIQILDQIMRHGHTIDQNPAIQVRLLDL